MVDRVFRKILASVSACLATFNGVDLFATGGPESRRRKKGPKKKTSWTLLAARYLFVHCYIRLMVNCVLQYSYDFHLSELECYHRSLGDAAAAAADNKTTDANDYEEIHQLEQQIALERSRIKLLGSPYMNVPYLLEVGYIYLTTITSFAFAVPQIYQHFRSPFNLGLVRAFVDRERELKNCHHLVVDEMTKLIESSRSFVLCVANDAKSANRDMLTVHIKSAILSSKQKLSNLTEHASTVVNLKQMSSSARFRPLNRTDNWLKWVSILAIVLHIILFVCAWTLIYFLTFYLTSHEEWIGKVELEEDFMDVVMRIEILIMCCIAELSGQFIVISMALVTIDQIYYLMQLNSMLLYCIKSTVSLINSIHRHLHNNDETVTCSITPIANYTQLNRNILESLIQYRVLIRQMKAIGNTCGCMASVFTIPIAMIPILCFMHATVFRGNMIFVLVLGTLLALLCLNLSLSLACIMHSRGINIYKSMLNLLIKLAFLRQVSFEREGANLLNSHLILSLSRELSIPERMIDQFKYKVMGIPITYQNMLKSQFWCILLILFALAIFRASSNRAKSESFTNPLMILVELY